MARRDTNRGFWKQRKVTEQSQTIYRRPMMMVMIMIVMRQSHHLSTRSLARSVMKARTQDRSSPHWRSCIWHDPRSACLWLSAQCHQAVLKGAFQRRSIRGRPSSYEARAFGHLSAQEHCGPISTWAGPRSQKSSHCRATLHGTCWRRSSRDDMLERQASRSSPSHLSCPGRARERRLGFGQPHSPRSTPP